MLSGSCCISENGAGLANCEGPSHGDAAGDAARERAGAIAAAPPTAAAHSANLVQPTRMHAPSLPRAGRYRCRRRMSRFGEESERSGRADSECARAATAGCTLRDACGNLSPVPAELPATPYLLIDTDIVERNLSRMAAYV